MGENINYFLHKRHIFNHSRCAWISTQNSFAHIYKVIIFPPPVTSAYQFLRFSN